MGRMVVWVALAAAAAALIFSGVQGQQAYNENDQLGYLCSDNKTLTQCSTYLIYRAKYNDTLQLISNRFQLSRQQIANASNIQDGQQLHADQLLFIPIPTCTCVTGRSQYNVTYVIQNFDTFYLVSLGTFEGLTTYQAVERANPSADPTKLPLGDNIVFPLRCTCPSSDQTAKGVQMLVTYPTIASDTVATIARAWSVSTDDILSANDLTQNSILQLNTTLLLPFKQTPTLSSLPSSPQTSPPPASPASSPPPPVATAPPSGGSSNIGLIVGVACGAAAAVTAILLLIIWLILRRRRKRALKFSPSRDNLYGGINYNSQKDNTEEADGKPKRVNLEGDFLAGMSDLVDSYRPIWYSFEEILEATHHFNAAYLIQGSMYRGVLRDMAVAIKKMKGGMSQELKILCKVHHTNLIKLLGISANDEDQVFLVYEYAENGSLAACLHNKSPFTSSTESSSSSSSYLRWNMRLQIAVDVATALEYIHDYTKPSFVHKDLKSSNILLDQSFRAKIANFGMAKLGMNLEDAPMLTKHIAGTQGYMAPEYLAQGIVTPKLDVYAFGVILLELLSGQEAILRSTHGGLLERDRFLSASIALILDSDQKMQKLKDWMDPVLQDSFYPQGCALEVAVLARSCVDDDPMARPNMRDVTYRLSKLLQISLEWEASGNTERDSLSAPIEGR